MSNRTPFLGAAVPGTTGNGGLLARTSKGSIVQKRRFWRMKCTANGTDVMTTGVDMNNSLQVSKDPASDEVAATQSESELAHEIEFSSQLSQDMPGSYSQISQFGAQKNLYKSAALNDILVARKIHLTGEQKAVLHTVLRSRTNVFFTGAAGTGKSVLLGCMIALLREKYGKNQVYVTASTGIAACNIGGMTLHRFAGVGLAQEAPNELAKKVRMNRKTLKRWRTAEVLMIDEVSMISGPLLTKLEEVARIVRKNDRPFGGIQIIVTGDLFQLPPVREKFCFESPVWNRIIQKTVNLTQVFRQRDPKLAKIMNQLRLGEVSYDANELLTSLSRPPRVPKGLVPTSLFPLRREVATANSNALRRIEGTSYQYVCDDWKRWPEFDLDKEVLAEKEIALKLGAQVMLIKNLDDTLVNGSIGRIVAFKTSKPFRETGALGNQAGNQESTNANGDPGKNDLKGDKPGKAKKERLDADAVPVEQAPSTSVFPVVKFVTPLNTVRFVMIQPETFEVTGSDGEILASRTQMPLLLAWALSIHKAQGQTLPYVSVDLTRIFEMGQTYVALSRATSIDGLQVRNFSPHKISANPIVMDFYKSLPHITAEEIRAGEEFFDSELLLRNAPQEPRQRLLPEQPRRVLEDLDENLEPQLRTADKQTYEKEVEEPMRPESDESGNMFSDEESDVDAIVEALASRKVKRNKVNDWPKDTLSQILGGDASAEERDVTQQRSGVSYQRM